MRNKKGHSEAQTYNEMVTDLIEQKERQTDPHTKGRSIYKAQSLDVQTEWLKEFLSGELSEVVQFATKEKISLGDLDEVKKRTVVYLKACAETGSFPSSLGLARALGYSDRALRYWRKNHAETETAQWLEMFNDSCANVLSQASLKNNANPVVAMFLNKALYGFVDDVKLIFEANTQVPTEEPKYSVEDIKKRYLLSSNNESN